MAQDKSNSTVAPAGDPPPSLAHVPLYVGEKFRGSSGAGGVYGDVIQEFDSAVGDMLKMIYLHNAMHLKDVKRAAV